MRTLIIASASPFARKARIALLEKGVAFEVEVDNPWRPAARALVHNPLGKIPVLLTEDDGAILDSRLIVEYVEAKWPLPALLPPGARNRIATRQIEVLADGVCEAVVLIVLERARLPQLQSRDWIMRQFAKVEAGVAEVERRLVPGPCYNGLGFGLADIALGCMLGYLDLRMPEFAWRERAPGLDRLFTTLSQRESFRATRPAAQTIASLA